MERNRGIEVSVKTIYGLIGLLLVAFLVNTIIAYKFGSAKVLIQDRQKYNISAENIDRTLDCLAMNIYREAGSEPFVGKVAVAQVTLNRAAHPKFPNDICKVVYQKNVIMERVVCQFSWYCENKPIKKPDNQAYRESYAVAKKVLLEGFRIDSLEDALYYHATYVHPVWPYERITQLGNHIFYRN